MNARPLTVLAMFTLAGLLASVQPEQLQACEYVGKGWVDDFGMCSGCIPFTVSDECGCVSTFGGETKICYLDWRSWVADPNSPCYVYRCSNYCYNRSYCHLEGSALITPCDDDDDCELSWVEGGWENFYWMWCPM